MFAEIDNNVIIQIVSCADCPPGFVEYPEAAEIHVGSDVRFYTDTGVAITAADALRKNLIQLSDNQTAVWEEGRYVVKDDHTAGNYWNKRTKALVKLNLGERPGTDITDVKPPHDNAEWKIDKWIVPKKAKADDARAKRDELLGECDFIMLSDHPATNKAAWKTYRQALRDVPEQAGFPETIKWPNKPAKPEIR